MMLVSLNNLTIDLIHDMRREIRLDPLEYRDDESDIIQLSDHRDYIGQDIKWRYHINDRSNQSVFE